MGFENVDPKMELMNKQKAELGASLHDEWRAPRKLEDETYEARVKVLTKNNEGKEKWYNEADLPEDIDVIKKQDIANTNFEDLDPNWQKENADAAVVVMDLVHEAVDAEKELDEAFIEEASAKVHDEWLKRNDWVLHPEWGNPVLAKPFAELPEDEQDKDRAQLIKGIKIYKQSI